VHSAQARTLLRLLTPTLITRKFTTMPLIPRECRHRPGHEVEFKVGNVWIPRALFAIMIAAPILVRSFFS
jgi:hypothetical protein